jgi:hypothetical protein
MIAGTAADGWQNTLLGEDISGQRTDVLRTQRPDADLQLSHAFRMTALENLAVAVPDPNRRKHLVELPCHQVCQREAAVIELARHAESWPDPLAMNWRAICRWS